MRRIVIQLNCTSEIDTRVRVVFEENFVDMNLNVCVRSVCVYIHSKQYISIVNDFVASRWFRVYNPLRQNACLCSNRRVMTFGMVWFIYLLLFRYLLLLCRSPLSARVRQIP